MRSQLATVEPLLLQHGDSAAQLLPQTAAAAVYKPCCSSHASR